MTVYFRVFDSADAHLCVKFHTEDNNVTYRMWCSRVKPLSRCSISRQVLRHNDALKVNYRLLKVKQQTLFLYHRNQHENTNPRDIYLAM